MHVRTAVSMTLCLAAAWAASAADVPAADRRAGVVRIGDASLAALTRYAVDGAARRLADPECQRVFGEFTDLEGRPLAERLSALGDDGPSFLERLLIYDGASHPLCREGATLAVTHPGSRVVLVCGNLFRQAYLGNPTLAEAVIIHEALHSLGLGENPPASQVITARVLGRCRRKS